MSFAVFLEISLGISVKQEARSKGTWCLPRTKLMLMVSSKLQGSNDGPVPSEFHPHYCQVNILEIQLNLQCHKSIVDKQYEKILFSPLQYFK